MKPVLPFLETMITQACNLSCAGCSNYSDLVHNGYVTWADGEQSLSRWLERVDIPDFGIMGGEPLMNPQVVEWIVGVRKLLPNSQIRFTTNGLLLPKHPELVDLLADIGNCVFKITVHTTDPELENIIQQILNRYSWEPVVEYGISRLRTDNNLRFHIKRPDIFYKTYQGTYEDMHPYHSNPVEAFDICAQQTCPLLYKDRIYKCSTSGLLTDTLAKVGNPNQDQWVPYIDAGISADCSNSELDHFIANFGKPHSMCGQCPSQQHTDSMLNHLATVSTKKYQLSPRF